MRNAKKTAVVVLVSLAFILMCAQAVLAAGSTEKKTQGPIELIYWRPVRSGGEKEATTQITAQFEKDNPNITVTVEYFPSSVLPDKVRTAFATDTAPDLISVDTHEAVQFAYTDNLLSLPPDLETFIRQNAFEGPLNSLTYEGKIIGVPLDSSNLVLAYNVDLVRKAGLDPDKPPQDWEEFIEWATRTTIRDASGKLQQAGFSFSTGDTHWQDTAWVFAAWVAAGGSAFWTTLDEVNFTDDAHVAALQLIQDLLWKYKVYEVGFIPGAFTLGKQAMDLGGPWTIYGMEKDAPDLEYRFSVMPPRFKGGKSGTTLGGWHMIVNKATKYPSEVWDYVRATVKKENRLLWARLSKRNPPYKDIANDPLFQNNPHMRVLVEQSFGKFGYGIGNISINNIQQDIAEAYDRAIVDQEDVRTVLKEAKEKADAAIKKRLSK